MYIYSTQVLFSYYEHNNKIAHDNKIRILYIIIKFQHLSRLNRKIFEVYDKYRNNFEKHNEKLCTYSSITNLCKEKRSSAN